MQKIEFFVPGQKDIHGKVETFMVAKQRARISYSRYGRAMAHTPVRTQVWEDMIRSEAHKHKPERPWESPIILFLTFYMPRAKSTPKNAKEHIKKPDISNLAKAAEDALNGIIYKDDSQVYHAIYEKQYVEEGKLVGVDICAITGDLSTDEKK